RHGGLRGRRRVRRGGHGTGGGRGRGDGREPGGGDARRASGEGESEPVARGGGGLRGEVVHVCPSIDAGYTWPLWSSVVPAHRLRAASGDDPEHLLDRGLALPHLEPAV